MAIAIISMFTLISCGKKEEIKLFPVKVKGKYGYVDKTGRMIINPKFSYAAYFSDGVALVTTGLPIDPTYNKNGSIDMTNIDTTETKYGFIREDGSYIIKPTYMSATSFSEGLAWVVKKGEKPIAIDTYGKVKITLKNNIKYISNFKEGLSLFSIIDNKGKTKCGFIDKTGKIVINPQFISSGTFSQNLCSVSNEQGKWGYIDKSGKLVINYQFDEADQFVNGLAVVKIGKKYGVIDKNGKYKINPQFDYMNADKDLFIFKTNDKYGWCDDKGKIIINPQFDNVLLFGDNDLAPIKTNSKWGYVDKKGIIKIKPQFDSALIFLNNIALVINSNKLGIINNMGKYIINPKYDGSNDEIIFYNTFGISKNYFVESDYFTPIEINKFLNFDDYNMDASFSDIMDKYGLTKNDLGVNSSILSYTTITRDISLIVNVHGNPYTERDYYFYYSYDFTPYKNIIGYSFFIALHNDRVQYINKIVSAIKIPEDYTMIKNDKSKIIYTNNKYLINIEIKDDHISIILLPKKYINKIK